MGYGKYLIVSWVRHIYLHVYFKNYWIWQLVLDGVADMDVGYKASDPGSKHHSGVDLSCSSCNFTETRDGLIVKLSP